MNPWTSLARTHGRRCVMSLDIDEATLDAVTARQCEVIFPLIKPLLEPRPSLIALDYGCGAGRFTRALQKATDGFVVGYDPCKELLLANDWWSNEIGLAETWDHFVVNEVGPYDLIFTAMVLGDPNVDPAAIADDITSILDPNGLLVLLEHMPETPKQAWWRFRPESFYRDLFSARGIFLDKLGTVEQLQNPVTVMAGRRP